MNIMTTRPSDPSKGPADENQWLEVVSQRVAKLRFGLVQIMVHDGRVTQVESVEKIRFVPEPKGGQNR
jgi:hypothetical protein